MVFNKVYLIRNYMYPPARRWMVKGFMSTTAFVKWRLRVLRHLPMVFSFRANVRRVFRYVVGRKLIIKEISGFFCRLFMPLNVFFVLLRYFCGLGMWLTYDRMNGHVFTFANWLFTTVHRYGNLVMILFSMVYHSPWSMCTYLWYVIRLMLFRRLSN